MREPYVQDLWVPYRQIIASIILRYMSGMFEVYDSISID